MLSVQSGSTAKSKREQAAAGLRAILANGAQFASYIYGITEAFGIGKRTVDQAKADINITLLKVPTPDGKTRWAWKLPEGDKDEDGPQSCGTQSEDDDEIGGEPEVDEDDADVEALRPCNLATSNGSMAESASEPVVGVESEPSPSVGAAQYTADATLPSKIARLQSLEGEVSDVGLITGPPCWSCGGTTYWMREQETGGGSVCAVCHPPPWMIAGAVTGAQGAAS